MPDPTEIRYDKASKTLFVSFDDGHSFSLPAELLRTQSPSAEVQGHSPEERTLVAGRRHVGITGIEPVGHYAVRLIFDDLHNTGLYSWTYLYHLGEHQAEIWRDYLDELAQAGLSRDPPKRM
jgi:DUF971 family protein